MKNQPPTLNINDIVLLKQDTGKYLEGFFEAYEEKSYSHLPHLADLPYDRRTTDPNKLAERYNECHNRSEDVLYDVAYWESMSELAKNEKKSIEKEINSIEYKLTWANNMQGTLDNVLTDQKEMYNQEIGDHLEGIDMLADNYFDTDNAEGYNFYLADDITEAEVNAVKTILQNGKEYGYLTQDQVDTIKDFAQNVENMANSLDMNELMSENGFYYSAGEEDYDFEGVLPEGAEGIEDWCIEMEEWADDLNTFADNYNLNNESNPARGIVENLWDVPQSTINEWEGQVKELKRNAKEKEIESNKYIKESEKASKIRKDYIEEGIRTRNRYENVANDNPFDTSEWMGLIQSQSNYNPDNQDSGSLIRTRQEAMAQAKKDYGKR